MPDDGYIPSLPFGIPNPTIGSTPDAGGTEPWTPAPATSHVYHFRLWRTDKYKLLKKFPGALGQGRTELEVTFRDEKTRGPTSTYKYFFDTPEAGQLIFDRMAASPHPYGEVVYPVLIKGGVPYTKSSV